MCYDLDSRPPVPPLEGGATTHRRLTLTSADGARVGAFEALAEGTPTRAAMVICPDVRGLHPFYEELALRFAEAGIDAIAVDYFARTATTDDRGEGFQFMDHANRTRWATLRADLEAAGAHLATAAPGRAVFSVGFCFGGRLSLLTPTFRQPAFAGAIGFYAWPVGESRGGVPAPAELVGEMQAPVLALFGGADQGIGPEAVATFEAALREAAVPHEIHTYAGAPHSYFDRKAADFAEASADSWRRLLAFVSANTPA